MLPGRLFLVQANKRGGGDSKEKNDLQIGLPFSLSLSHYLFTLSAASEKIENLLKGRSGSKSCCSRLPAKLLEC